MRYSGGKGHIAKHLAPVLLALPHKRVLEPFFGGLSMTVPLQPELATDLSPAVVTLVDAIRKGWEPPIEFTNEAYLALKVRAKETDDPLVCFAGHCASWGGKWFGGLARGHKRQREPIRAAAVKLKERVRACPETSFRVADYADLETRAGDLVYCDPPYQGVTNGYVAPDFDHKQFWNWVRETSKSVTVVVSEYTAPEDFRSIYTLRHAASVHKKNHEENTHRLDQLWVVS